MWRICVFFVAISGLFPPVLGNQCDRTPEGILKPKNTRETDKYVIEVSGNPTTYVPEENYTVILTYNPLYTGIHMFKDFFLTVEHISTSEEENPMTVSDAGTFKLGKDLLSSFSRRCENTMVQTSSVPKLEVEVNWVAPSSGSGCVAFRATVVESQDNWFSDDGYLTKILCEEAKTNDDVQPPVLEKCCACVDAKYELSFEGRWSRNTHPKDFPSNVWETKLGDIIGATHINGGSFWQYGLMASESMKMLGEYGITINLENELKAKMGTSVRTIIKANALTYPNTTSKTFTVFRVDNQHHLISIASKIHPSPDWIVGASDLELCQRNCTWADQVILNLYPWDIGTDEAPSYNSPREPSYIKTPIKMIRSNSPNNPNSPFYSAEGIEMKPLARLHLTRLKVYDKDCDGSDAENDNEDPSCATSEWSPWSSCSQSCGKGFKIQIKELLRPENADMCKHVQLMNKEPCEHFSPKCESKLPEDDPKCELNDYGEWSGCSVRCGKGWKTRDRKFKYPEYAEDCSNNEYSVLQETKECDGEAEDCTDEEKAQEIVECPNTEWSPWTLCNVTCGTGIKERLRLALESDDKNEEEVECDGPVKEEVECSEPECTEDEPTENPEEATEEETGEKDRPQNCKATDFSIWGPCEPEEGICGKGYKIKQKLILVQPKNGGKSCPRKMMRRKGCSKACKRHTTISTTTTTTEENWIPIQPAPINSEEREEKVDCVMSPWSAWSPCSLSCGSSAVQQKTRSIRRHPSKTGKPCGPRIKTRACPLPLACTDKGQPII